MRREDGRERDRAAGRGARDATAWRSTAVAREHGTPLYVYSARAIEAAFRAYERAFAPVPHRICYAVKANGNGAILRLLAASAPAPTSSPAASCSRRSAPASRRPDRLRRRREERRGDRARPRAGHRRVERRERGGDPAASTRGLGPGPRRARVAARQPGHRRRAHTRTSRRACGRRSSASTSASPPRSCAARGDGRASRSSACSATSARR